MDAWTDWLDPFVVAYRDDPTEENRRVLMDAQALHAERFYREQTIDFMARTTSAR